MFRANPEYTGVYESGGIEPGNTELWRFATGGIVYSSPAVANGVVYIGSDDKNLYAIGANSLSLTTIPTAIPSTQITLLGTTKQQTIASTPITSPLSGQNSDPTASLPILAIVLTGGGYVFYRLKNRP